MENFDKINVGPVTRNGEGRINIDFPAGDTAGVALDVGPTPASASAKAVIKLGDHYIGQNAAGAFSLVNAAGEETVLSYAGDVATAAQVEVNRVRSNYAIAIATGNTWVHMAMDDDLSALAALDETPAVTTQAQANARANALKASAIAHAADVVASLTPASDGAHFQPDTTASGTLALVAAASDLATSKTLTTALFDWLVAHAEGDGAHFAADTAAAALTVTDTTPDDLTEVCVVLNELLVAFREHYARGTV